MIDDVIEIAGDEAKVDWHVNGPDQGRAEESVHYSVVVLRDDGDAVAFFDAQAKHQISPAVHPLSELIVGQAQVAGDYRLAIAVHGQSALEEIVFVERNYHDKTSRVETVPRAVAGAASCISLLMEPSPAPLAVP